MKRSKAPAIIGAGIVTAALVFGAAGRAEAQTWTAPEGAHVTNVKVTKHKTKHHRKVTTTITYRPLEYFTPAPEDLIGSVLCKADTRRIYEDTRWAYGDMTEGSPFFVTYEGTCRTNNVFIAPASNVSYGFEWKTVWFETEIDPTGEWYTPWEAEGIQTMPAIPYYGDPVKIKITKSIRRHT